MTKYPKDFKHLKKTEVQNGLHNQKTSHLNNNLYMMNKSYNKTTVYKLKCSDCSKFYFG